MTCHDSPRASCHKSLTRCSDFMSRSARNWRPSTWEPSSSPSSSSRSEANSRDLIQENGSKTKWRWWQHNRTKVIHVLRHQAESWDGREAIIKGSAEALLGNERGHDDIRVYYKNGTACISVGKSYLFRIRPWPSPAYWVNCKSWNIWIFSCVFISQYFYSWHVGCLYKQYALFTSSF